MVCQSLGHLLSLCCQDTYHPLQKLILLHSLYLSHVVGSFVAAPAHVALQICFSYLLDNPLEAGKNSERCKREERLSQQQQLLVELQQVVMEAMLDH